MAVVLAAADAVLPVRITPANQTNPKALAAAVVDAVAGTDLTREIDFCFSIVR